jgi:hypothetical protein
MMPVSAPLLSVPQEIGQPLMAIFCPLHSTTGCPEDCPVVAELQDKGQAEETEPSVPLPQFVPFTPPDCFAVGKGFFEPGDERQNLQAVISAAEHIRTKQAAEIGVLSK